MTASEVWTQETCLMCSGQYEGGMVASAVWAQGTCLMCGGQYRGGIVLLISGQIIHARSLQAELGKCREKESAEMNFHILTLFPEMIENGLNTSIIGRAVNAGLLSVNAVNIRDYAFNKHQSVDDYPYGGGAGMLMQAEPVYLAYESVAETIRQRGAKGKPRVIYLSPQGDVFSQDMAGELAKEEDLVLLCGHYEGIDERVLEEIVTDYVSIGDYVLTGGELPAMVMVDAISRLVPGVLHNDVSAEFESFQDNLLEYPQYSRPEEWHGKKVPPVLLSGHHANIEKWRREQSILRTHERRPDLLEKSNLSWKERQWLKEQVLEHESQDCGQDEENVCMNKSVE